MLQSNIYKAKTSDLKICKFCFASTTKFTNLRVSSFASLSKPLSDLFIITRHTENWYLHVRLRSHFLGYSYSMCHNFYDMYCKGVRFQSHMQLQVFFVWLLIINRSDDGWIEQLKLVTWSFVNCVLLDSVLNMYRGIYF